MPLALLVMGILSCALAFFGWVFYIACVAVILATIGLVLYGVQSKQTAEGTKDKRLSAALVLCLIGLVVNIIIVLIWVFTQAGIPLSPFPSPSISPILD